MSAFALYGFLAFLIEKPVYIKLLFFVLASLAALARVYLGQHFLMDVLGGAAFGTSVAAVFYFIFLKFEKATPSAK
jgi:undecaprenyl-diphosphatase